MIRTTATKVRIFISNFHYRFKYRLKNLVNPEKRRELADLKKVELIRNNGERATHIHPNDTFIAHLAIYDFAIQFCRGLDVLDAGSGSGYGSAYLAEHGAKQVVGIELDDYAVEFSKQNFGNIPNLTFQQMNLEKINDFKENEFDVVFSSNVLEHVPDAYAFFAEVSRILKPSGKLILAVPPMDNMTRITSNLNNHYHVNIWSMRHWLHVLQQYFNDIAPYSHMYIGKQPFITGNKPEDTKITIADFEFTEYPVTAERIPTMTVMFLASSPRKQLGSINRDYVDSSFTVNVPGQIKFDRGILCSDIISTTQTHVGRLRPGNKFCQSFKCSRDRLAGIALCFGTYRKNIDSTIKFTLLDDKESVIYSLEKSTLDTPDNYFYPFLFPPVPDSSGRLFTFCIETIASSGEAITLWTNDTVKNACTKNGSPVPFGLLYKCCFR